MKELRLRSQSGFSLIELMVVVAIIGILAAIAVPNFQRFQAKSRQSEAKANLGAMYSAEKAFFAEWNNYFADFRDIGFAPEGQLHYHIGFANAGSALPANIGYSGPSNNVIPQVAAVNATLFDSGTYCPAATGGNGACTETPFAAGKALPAAATIVNGAAASFKAGATGCINAGGSGCATTDQWTMDQIKNLGNIQSGIDGT